VAQASSRWSPSNQPMADDVDVAKSDDHRRPLRAVRRSSGHRMMADPTRGRSTTESIASASTRQPRTSQPKRRISRRTQRTSTRLPLSSLTRFQNSGLWLAGGAGVLLLLGSNWRLLLATGAGIAAMTAINTFHQRRWRRRWAQLSQPLRKLPDLLKSPVNRQIVLTIGGGSVALLSTYMATAIWADTTSHWVAAGVILQGIGTLALLALLMGRWLQGSEDTGRTSLDQRLSALTEEDPLKRLIAVRQLTALAASVRTGDQQRAAVADCFRMMLSRENDPIVQEAVFDGLQTIERFHPSESEAAVPLKLPRRPAAPERSLH